MRSSDGSSPDSLLPVPRLDVSLSSVLESLLPAALAAGGVFSDDLNSLPRLSRDTYALMTLSSVSDPLVARLVPPTPSQVAAAAADAAAAAASLIHFRSLAISSTLRNTICK